MRLVLLTVEGKGLRLEIQKKTTSSAREPGEIAEGKKHTKTKSVGTRKGGGGEEDDTRKWREVKIILREFHLSTRRGVERRGARREVRARKVVQPFYPTLVLSYSRSFRVRFSFCFHARSVPRGMR